MLCLPHSLDTEVFSPVIETTVYKGVTWPLLCHPVEINARGSCTNGTTLATAIIVSNKPSAVSDPVVLCLLLASMRMWQANLAACN